MSHITPRATLFPYTTLFRSVGVHHHRFGPQCGGKLQAVSTDPGYTSGGQPIGEGLRFAGRSEEHTSELQSQSNLVCRLLLEKKKVATHTTNHPHNNLHPVM